MMPKRPLLASPRSDTDHVVVADEVAGIEIDVVIRPLMPVSPSSAGIQPGIARRNFHRFSSGGVMTFLSWSPAKAAAVVSRARVRSRGVFMSGWDYLAKDLPSCGAGACLPVGKSSVKTRRAPHSGAPLGPSA